MLSQAIINYFTIFRRVTFHGKKFHPPPNRKKTLPAFNKMHEAHKLYGVDFVVSCENHVLSEEVCFPNKLTWGFAMMFQLQKSPELGGGI